MDKKKLCLELAKSDDGDNVIRILKKYNLWDNFNNWHIIGSQINDHSLNNHGTIGNQQSNPANALVEKLVNCGDSALMLECKLKNIDPRGSNAPKSVREATEKLFGIEQGRWINALEGSKDKIAEKYCNLVATGAKGRGKDICPTYTVFDSAEGQHPKDFKTTFMSLNRVNKVEIPFVQGTHGMGSFGAINFCKKEGLQLIISKKNKQLVSSGNNHFGFTIVRRVYPDQDFGESNSESYGSSRWVYLVIDGEVPSFNSEYLDILPSKYPEPYGNPFYQGTFIKLYNYDIGSGLRSNVTLDLFNKISELLPNPIVPIRVYERRDGYRANSYESTIDGLETRLDRDRSSILADGFPSEFIFNANNQQIKGKIYAFNKYSDPVTKKLTDVGNYGNGIKFVLNGQTNGSLGYRFFSTKGLTYENISKNLLVKIDCSQISRLYIEEFFANDRERIKVNEFTDNVKSHIAEELKNHAGLKKFQNNWRSSQIDDFDNDEKNNELFTSLLKKNPNIVSYLTGGKKLVNPINRGDHEEVFESNYFPEFFTTKKLFSSKSPRELEKDRHARIMLITDAPNDYFTRHREPGFFEVTKDDKNITNLDGVGLSGYNGNWILNLPPCEEEEQSYTLSITDNNKIEPLDTKIYIKLVPKTIKPQSPSKPKKDKSVNVDPPKIYYINKNEWRDYDFDDKDILKIEQQGDEDYRFYLNVDNIYVLNYLKSLKDFNVELAKKHYSVAMQLIGLVILTEYKEKENNNNFEKPLGEYSKEYTRVLSPIIMNVIRDIDRSL
jgi:hypothetical protein